MNYNPFDDWKRYYTTWNSTKLFTPELMIFGMLKYLISENTKNIQEVFLIFKIIGKLNNWDMCILQKNIKVIVKTRNFVHSKRICSTNAISDFLHANLRHNFMKIIGTSVFFEDCIVF